MRNDDMSYQMVPVVRTSKPSLSQAIALSDNGNGNAEDRVRKLYGQLADLAQRNGVNMDRIATNGGACGVPNSVMAGAIVPGQYVAWSPSLGACPNDMDRILCWWHKSLCSFNKFGQIGSVALRTNVLNLPHPVTQFAIGPEGAAQALGVFFPRDWSAESAFHGLYRFKVSFTVNILEGGLTPEAVARQLFDDLEFKIIQVGTQDNLHTALNIGQAQDAERSTDAPPLGGFYLPAGREFVPYFTTPEIFAFDFRGIAPGTVGVDAYSVSAKIQTYWKPVC
jgi:hypothetical protein